MLPRFVGGAGCRLSRSTSFNIRGDATASRASETHRAHDAQGSAAGARLAALRSAGWSSSTIVPFNQPTRSHPSAPSRRTHRQACHLADRPEIDCCCLWCSRRHVDRRRLEVADRTTTGSTMRRHICVAARSADKMRRGFCSCISRSARHHMPSVDGPPKLFARAAVAMAL